ncbi:MAG: TMEM175 family protein [Anaerolineae bacterium]
MSEQSSSQAEISETNRLEAFSDGVFAIAITLLVLEIRLPHVEATEGGHLASDLLALWPTYLAYIISFITIGIMWINHHAVFKMIHRTDRTLIFLNALLLMVITFLNFPTVVLSEYLQSPDGNVAAVFYSGTLFIIAILYNVL